MNLPNPPKNPPDRHRSVQQAALLRFCSSRSKQVQSAFFFTQPSLCACASSLISGKQRPPHWAQAHAAHRPECLCQFTSAVRLPEALPGAHSASGLCLSRLATVHCTGGPSKDLVNPVKGPKAAPVPLHVGGVRATILRVQMEHRLKR